MPWLPLAILLIAALTIAALALILFPPGEAREQAVEDDITEAADEEAAEGDMADNVGDEVAEDDFSPPPVDGDPPLRGEGDEVPSNSGTSIAPTPPSG